MIKIGMIGCDTSHCAAFTELLNDTGHPHHVPGGRVVCAYAGGSPDFELSISRVPRVVEVLQDRFGVAMRTTPESVAEEADAILLTSVDGRVHLEQFERIAPFGKPVFIDKPFAVDAESAREMFSLARKHQVGLMSCSSLRYSDVLRDVLSEEATGAVIGADFFGPMLLQATQPGLFWYGIHTVEMLYRTLGTGCCEVRAVRSESHELVTGRWRDGRIGIIRGNRLGNKQFGGIVHRDQGSRYVNLAESRRPNYAGLLEAVLRVFQGEQSPIPEEETVEVIRFIEAANQSRGSGDLISMCAAT